METILSAVIGAAALILAAYIARPDHSTKNQEAPGGANREASPPQHISLRDTVRFVIRKRSAALALCGLALGFALSIFFALPFFFALWAALALGLLFLLASELPIQLALLLAVLGLVWGLYELALLVRGWLAA